MRRYWRKWVWVPWDYWWAIKRVVAVAASLPGSWGDFGVDAANKYLGKHVDEIALISGDDQQYNVLVPKNAFKRKDPVSFTLDSQNQVTAVVKHAQ